jgi:hypothetical protein
VDTSTVYVYVAFWWSSFKSILEHTPIFVLYDQWVDFMLFHYFESLEDGTFCGNCHHILRCKSYNTGQESLRSRLSLPPHWISSNTYQEVQEEAIALLFGQAL